MENDIPDEEMKEALIRAAAHNGTLDLEDNGDGTIRCRGMFIVDGK